MKKKIFAVIFAVFVFVALWQNVSTSEDYAEVIFRIFQGTLNTIFPKNFIPWGLFAYFFSHLLLILSSLIFLYQAFEKEIKKLLNVDEWKARAEEHKRVKREQEKVKLQAQIEENKAKLQEMEKAE